jgi:anaerobic magnesium-protoporphyrin IX monomethyl ester cyclase
LKMKILLINPPYPVCESLTMPLGLLYLAARLEQDGHEVVLEDMQLASAPITRLRKTLLRTTPQVVGITSFSINLHSAGRLLRAVRHLCPEAITVWGGPHVSFDDENVLRHNPWVDVIVRGEGEETLTEVAKRAGAGDGFDGIPGTTWRKPDGEIRRNLTRPFQKNIDLWPRPAWHLLKLSQYLAFGDGVSVLTSRGCPHRCVFCVGRKMIGAQGRFRDPIAVVDEMEALTRFGFKRIRVEDDLFTFRKERAVSICREIDRRKLPIQWRAYARVDTVDPQLLGWMKKAGCERLLFGAESGSPEILKRIRKGITPEQTRRAVEMTRQAGIGVLASFVLGLPGETPVTLKQTVEFADSLQVPYTLNLLTPYMGTEIRERSGEWGIQICSDDWKLYGQGHPLTSTPTVSRRQLSRAVNRYREGISQYLRELLEREERGGLTERDAEDLERQRYWHFLRKLIGEEILERFDPPLSGAGHAEINFLARSIAPPLEMRREEAEKHLERLTRAGNIRQRHSKNGGFRWGWAEN